MPPNSLTLTIPVRTKNPLNNPVGSRRGRFAAAARTKRERQSAYYAVIARGAVPYILTVDPVNVTLTRVAPSDGLDDDKLPAALAGIRDGIADAINPNASAARRDRDPRITWRYSQRRGKPKEYAVEITIERKEMGG